MKVFQIRSRVARALPMLLLLLASSAVAAMLCEILTRTFLPQQEIPEWFRPDPQYGFAVKPDFSQDYHYVGHDFVMHVKTNSLGFRDREWTFPRPDGTKTLLLLGDSYVFGYGVNIEERLDARLEAMLKSEAAPWQVLNLGVPGWGTRNEAAFARSHFDLFMPDVIVLLFCGNDPSDDAGGYKPALPTGRWIPAKAFLRAHFQLYRLLLRQAALLRHKRQLLATQQREPNTVHFDAQTAVFISEQQWKGSLALINDLYRDFRTFNPQGLLLILATAPEDENIRTHLASLNNGSDLRYVDLEPRVSLLPPEARSQPHDGHWSPHVHQIAAQEIFKILDTRSHRP